MEHKIEKLIWQTQDITCDMCNQSCKKEENTLEYGTLYAAWGYFSQYDSLKEECHLCEICFVKVKEFIQSQGGIVRNQQY